jgi:hypothetical protein
MAMTLGYAIVSTDIFGIQSPDNQFFILPDREDRPALLQPGTGCEKRTCHEHQKN